MPVTSQATLGPTCLCSHCSCCVRMAARPLLRLGMPGRAAAFSGHLIVVTGDLHRQEVGLTIITSTQELASAALPFSGQLPVKRRVGKAYTGLLVWPRPKHLASSYFSRCAGHPGCKLQRPFHVCLASLLVLRRGTECKGRPRLKTCKQTFSQLLRKTGSSPPTPHPLHCGKSS